MGKNIVICCDGTGNEYGEHNTNVVKLYSILPKNDKKQVTYYDPGVGTLSLPALFTRAAKAISKLCGLAFGAGITGNIARAYQFLMRTYEPGDDVYLFGFSRGAYTVRAVAAMLYKCGLLDSRNDNLLPYALNMFKKERRPEVYAGFRRSFSRQCSVHFLGLWDTVTSVGWIYDPLSLQFTTENRIIKVVRQAISIDERRCFYRQNLWGRACPGQSVKQVWFAGVHSDVGGSYPEPESSLSQITLEWMIEEARSSGLRINEKRYRTAVPVPGNERIQKPEREYHAPPDCRGPIHKSLKGLWWLAEILPKRYSDPKDNYRKKWSFPFGKWRWIPGGSLIHESVLCRKQALGYAPPNLPKEYEAEPCVRRRSHMSAAGAT